VRTNKSTPTVLSIAIGSIVALMQTNIKRLLAYSTISHVGFVLLGFSTGVISGYGAAVFIATAAIFGTVEINSVTEVGEP
jgi:NADH:ubiquinone oxidoreductase subunit 2 (subunit N)